MASNSHDTRYPQCPLHRKRIFKRFNEEGIEIPFPHRTVYLREEKEWRK
jgi:small-conductance mechanosensitive channel